MPQPSGEYLLWGRVRKVKGEHEDGEHEDGEHGKWAREGRVRMRKGGTVCVLTCFDRSRRNRMPTVPAFNGSLSKVLQQN